MTKISNHGATERSWQHNTPWFRELRGFRLSPHLRGSVVPWLQGQVTIEYFILFAMMAVVTILGFASLNGGLRTDLQNFLNAAAAKIAQ